MKILNVMWSSGAPFASVHKVHRTVLEALGAAGTHTWLLQGVQHPTCETVGEVTAWRLSGRLLKGRRLWRLAASFLQYRLARAIDMLAPECVLIDGIGTARVMLPILASRPAISVLIVVHGRARLLPKDRLLLAQFSSRKITVAAVSETLAMELRADLPEWSDRIVPFATALSPARFADELLGRSEARKQLGIRSHELALGCVGRLVESKGVSTLLAAFANVANSHPNCILTLVGDGDRRKELEEKAACLGLAKRVRFAGHCVDVARLYRAFDWIVIPSHREGQGLVLQEAVLADVAVMLSNIAVFREQLGSAGLYADPGDVDAWSDLLGRCLAAEPEAYAKAQRAHLAPERAWERFSLGYRNLFNAATDRAAR